MIENHDSRQLNTKHNYPNELIGEVVDENGKSAIQDLYSDDKLYPLKKQSNTALLGAGSIIGSVAKKSKISQTSYFKAYLINVRFQMASLSG